MSRWQGIFEIISRLSETTAAKLTNEQLYQSLDGARREIRLLCLHPSYYLDGDIQASLKIISLDNPPPFRALSYCWGDSCSTKSIVINHHKVKVTDNLESALRHVREPKRTVILWVDALSINQDDIEERNAQVRLMAHIYKSATSVLAWLGETSDDSDHAMNMARKWGRKHLNRHSRYLIQKIRTEKFDERSWTAMNKLLNRSYWTRTWIYQELVLGRKVYVRCGNKQIDWDCVKGLDEASYQLERKMDLFRLELNPVHLNMVVESGLDKLSLFLNFDKAKEQSATLFPMLQWTSVLSCKDPRDHIYAIMGLARDADCYPEPDYSQDVVSVYTAFAQAQIELTGNLDILHETACRRTNKKEYDHGRKLPSWVPDWTIRANHHMPYRAHEELYHSSPIGGKTPISDNFHSSFSTIKVHGIHIDSISRVSPKSIIALGLPETIAFIEGAQHKYDDRDYRYLKDFAHIHPTGLPLMNVVFRTCLLDIDFRFALRLDFDSCPEVPLQLVEGFLMRLAMSYGFMIPRNLTEEQMMDLQIPPFDLDFEFLPPGSEIATQFPHFATFKNFQTFIDTEPGNEIRPMLMRMFDRHFEHFTTGRTLFGTPKGYVGLSTNDDVREGDVLAVLHGCKTPVILRPLHDLLLSSDDEHFEFVSDAFVYGLMDGEAVQNVSDNEKQTSITLESKRLDSQCFFIH